MHRFRQHYGAGPLHLAAVLGCLAVSAYVVTRIDAEGGLVRIVAWFVIALIAHDLVLWPLYTLADRRLIRADRRRRRGRPPVPWINHVRAPVLVSGLLLLISFPLIAGANASYYSGLTGRSERPYFWHWLLITAVLFAGSGLIYAVRLGRGRGHGPAARGRRP